MYTQMVRNITVRRGKTHTKKVYWKVSKERVKKIRTNYKGVPIKFEKVNQRYRDVCYLEKWFIDSLHHITFNLNKI